MTLDGDLTSLCLWVLHSKFRDNESACLLGSLQELTTYSSFPGVGSGVGVHGPRKYATCSISARPCLSMCCSRTARGREKWGGKEGGKVMGL